MAASGGASTPAPTPTSGSGRGAEFRTALSIYGSLVGASLRGQLGYRRSFLLELVGRLSVTGFELVALFFLFARVESIGGWTRWEVVYLYGMASLCLGLAEALTASLDELPELIRTGRIDYFLVRPVPALLLVLGRDLELRILGRAIQGAFALVFALVQLDVAWSLLIAGFLTLSVLAGVLVYASVFLMAAAQCFWTVESTEMFNAFTYGGAQLTAYPLGVYPGWIRVAFLYLVPVGFVSYVPALVVLGKSDPLGLLPWAPWLVLPIALAFLGAALLCWKLGTRRYEGAGG